MKIFNFLSQSPNFWSYFRIKLLIEQKMSLESTFLEKFKFYIILTYEQGGREIFALHNVYFSILKCRWSKIKFRRHVSYNKLKKKIQAFFARC